jgi:hypothetical protein
MGNEHKWRIVTLQGSVVPSKPLDVTLVGLQASQCYCPTLTMHANLLVTMFIVYSTLEHLFNINYYL